MTQPILPLFSPADVREVDASLLPDSLPFRFTPKWLLFRARGRVFFHVWTRYERLFVDNLVKAMAKRKKNASRDS